MYNKKKHGFFLFILYSKNCSDYDKRKYHLRNIINDFRFVIIHSNISPCVVACLRNKTVSVNNNFTIYSKVKRTYHVQHSLKVLFYKYK